MVGFTHQTSTRRKKNLYPSQALVACLAALVTPSVLARPILLPFLYPSIPPSPPRPKRSAGPSSSSTSTRTSSPEQRRAERLAYNFEPDDQGHFKPTCWSLHGQSNCPRTTPVDSVIDSIDSPHVRQVLPVVFPTSTFSTPQSTSTATSASPRTTIALPTSAFSAPASVTTVEPYTMPYQVSNIPPGWQRTQRTSFYSKDIIIGFSVTLAALICLTIALCVIWRVRAARNRKDSEKALRERKKKKQAEFGTTSMLSDDSASFDDNDHDRESTRQRGLRRRRANVRADPASDHEMEVEENDDKAMSEKNGGRNKPRTAFMRSFKGKMPMTPSKWNRSKRRKQREKEEDERDEEEEVDERPESEIVGGPERSGGSHVAPPPVEGQNPSPSTPPIVQVSLPVLPPPARLAEPPAPTSEDDPNSTLPPAYRRRNFGFRSRGAAAPTAGMTPRAMEKQREAEGDVDGVGEGGVPEEYRYLAGISAPPLAPASGQGERRVGLPVQQDRDEEDEEEDEELGEEQDGEGRDFSAHLATDDKSVLARLQQSSSRPSAPPLAPGLAEASFTTAACAIVPTEEELYDLEEEASGGSGSRLGPPRRLEDRGTVLLPLPPTITSAHLFFPPPATDDLELPGYVAGPSVPSSVGQEKSPRSERPAPSEPPVEVGALVPSAPPLHEEDVLVPSAPPLEE